MIGASNSSAASYTPDLDRVLLLVGQNVESVTGYVTNVGIVPGGVMSYTSTAGVEGLGSEVNYGSGLIYAQRFINDPAYNNTVLQLGLYLNGDLDNIINGSRAGNISTIGNWIKSTGRPVYLRIGYEFDAPWNALDPNKYITAYRYIVDRMRADGVTNVVFVWHSACSPTFGGNPISAWYPGDDYVDWAGISVFHQFDGTLGTVQDIDSFCNFAKSKNKPLMIAESTPFGGISDARWTNWFVPCLDLIRKHHIQMWCYINTDWDSQSIFAGQGWGDSRIERNAFIKSNWLATINSPKFLQASDQLMPRLHVKANNIWREAESATLNGATVFTDPWASGGSAVGGLNAPGRSASFLSSGPAQQFVLRYSANASGTIGLYINSQPRRTLPISATGGGVYRDQLVHGAIPAGATVKIQFDSGDVSANLDFIEFRGYDDTDQDSLPDDWERWRFGSLAQGPNGDPDGDGSSNYAEFVADTNPMDRASSLRISRLDITSGTAKIEHVGTTNRDCFIQQSTDSHTWTFLANTTEENSTRKSVPLAIPPPAQAMFRLYVP